VTGISYRLVGAIASAAALLAGCGGASSGDSSDVPSGDTSDALLTRSPYVGLGPQAAITGDLDLDLDRGCILLSGKAVVWPTDTTFTRDPPALHFPGGLTARSGDTVGGTGGEVTGADIPDTTLQIEGDVEKALACAPSNTEVVVFNAGSPMTVSSG
jgi:hypothetical protein